MSPKLTAIVVGILLAIFVGQRFVKVVPPGHVGVAIMLGKVMPKPYQEGLNIPVNPLYEWVLFDQRQKTYKETIQVPTRDQLRTKVDLSIQWRIVPDMAPEIFQSTGDQAQLQYVHLIPNLRSLAREQGSKIQKAEDFFLDETRDELATGLYEGLRANLAPKGIEIQAVLVRDIVLPTVLAQAIEEKKKRQQEVEKQKAELDRYREEQQQQVAAAEAQLSAAGQEAQQIRLLAKAKADEIRLINDAIAKNPAYIQLQSLEALKAISKDPAAKIYFLDGSSPQPLPLMHLGETVSSR
jgi:regulator of protease activity HflC (stomatin/prohibitin superfamily)